MALLAKGSVVERILSVTAENSTAVEFQRFNIFAELFIDLPVIGKTNNPTLHDSCIEISKQIRLLLVFTRRGQ